MPAANPKGLSICSNLLPKAGETGCGPEEQPDPEKGCKQKSTGIGEIMAFIKAKMPPTEGPGEGY